MTKKTKAGGGIAISIGDKSQSARQLKEHKLDMEYAIFGLGRDADVKKSVFKALNCQNGCGS